MSIQYKVEENLLTTPPSYSIRFVSRGSAGREDIAADIALRHPNFSKADILTILNAEDEAIMGRLLNGEQVTKEGCCSWFPSFTGKLDNPDDPLPPLDQCLHLNVRVSPPFVEDFSKDAQVERLASTEKLPVINAAEDTVLGLRDVLRADGMLRITGSNLAFDRQDSSQHCLIEGTRSGSAVQSRIGAVSNTEIVLMPDVPSQPEPWNNEYQLSVTVRYTEHGSLRTGIYKRRLRSPLTLTKMGHPNPPEVGILTGKETSPHVSVTGGSVAANETLRIQAVFDTRADALLFSLLDMQENGKTGAAVSVTANGAVSVPGFSGSAVTNLSVRVNTYAALKEMIRSSYGGRIADILQVQTA
jgi:hypothetical protein